VIFITPALSSESAEVIEGLLLNGILVIWITAKGFVFVDSYGCSVTSNHDPEQEKHGVGVVGSRPVDCGAIDRMRA
jgi:hypothetical protein